MPARPTLPRNAKRLPKGTNRHDYEPEVFAQYVRDKARQYKAAHRRKQRHHGYRDVTFALSKIARENLTRMCKDVGMSKSQLLNYLLENHHVKSIQSQQE